MTIFYSVSDFTMRVSVDTDGITESFPTTVDRDFVGPGNIDKQLTGKYRSRTEMVAECMIWHDPGVVTRLVKQKGNSHHEWYGI